MSYITNDEDDSENDGEAQKFEQKTMTMKRQ